MNSYKPIVLRYPLAGSILPCGLSPLYHEYRGSTLNPPEVLLTNLLWTVNWSTVCQSTVNQPTVWHSMCEPTYCEPTYRLTIYWKPTCCEPIYHLPIYCASQFTMPTVFSPLPCFHRLQQPYWSNSFLTSATHPIIIFCNACAQVLLKVPRTIGHFLVFQLVWWYCSGGSTEPCGLNAPNHEQSGST